MIKKLKYKNVLGKDFKTKTEAYKHFVSLRDQIALGTVLDETTAIKKSQMNQLFKDYFYCTDEDYYKRKIGLGIKDWSFNRDSQGGVCLWIHQQDEPNNLTGFLKEISIANQGQQVPVAAKWIFTCFGTGVLMDENKMHRVKQAARKAVEIQKKDFRNITKPNCNKCGFEVHGLEAEVDHKDPTFTNLFKNFFKKFDEELLINNITKTKTEDIWYFSNDKIKKEWQEYHQKNAVLQLLCKNCHKNKTSIEKKGYKDERDTL